MSDIVFRHADRDGAILIVTRLHGGLRFTTRLGADSITVDVNAADVARLAERLTRHGTQFDREEAR